ncbi:MAG TPA: hypothetical protein VIL69_13340 [Roseomonas sp.]|jgi:hypothetical protein
MAIARRNHIAARAKVRGLMGTMRLPRRVLSVARQPRHARSEIRPGSRVLGE